MAPEAPPALVRCMFGLLHEGKVGRRADRLAVYSYVTWRSIASTDDLSTRDVKAIIGTLEYWKACGQIEYRCRRIAEATVSS